MLEGYEPTIASGLQVFVGNKNHYTTELCDLYLLTAAVANCSDDAWEGVDLPKSWL